MSNFVGTPPSFYNCFLLFLIFTFKFKNFCFRLFANPIIGYKCYVLAFILN